MTLILNHLSHAWAIQATDRLVSRGAVKYDPESNKNLLLLVENGIVTIGYSGLSYLEGLTTDEWIAQKLVGEPIARGHRGGPSLYHFKRRQLPTLGPAVARLASELANLSARTPQMRKYPVMLSVTGWMMYRRKEARPVFCVVGPQSEAELTDYTARWLAARHFGRTHYLAVMPNGYVSNEERRELYIRLGHLGNPAAAKDLLAEKVREVANRNPQLVGADCMAISVSPPRYRQVIIEYVTAQAKEGLLKTSNGEFAVPHSFTPWVISPVSVAAPSVMSPGTGTTLNVGAWTIQFRGPGEEGDFHFAQSQERKPPPT
jgi:hypothetical protein